MSVPFGGGREKSSFCEGGEQLSPDWCPHRGIFSASPVSSDQFSSLDPSFLPLSISPPDPLVSHREGGECVCEQGYSSPQVLTKSHRSFPVWRRLSGGGRQGLCSEGRRKSGGGVGHSGQLLGAGPESWKKRSHLRGTDAR